MERAEALNLPVVAANIFLKDTGAQAFPSSRIVEMDDGTVIGIVGAFGGHVRLRGGAAMQIRVDPPRAAVERAVAELVEQVDLVVMVAHMQVGAARRLAEQIPALQLVVCGHDGRPMRTIRKYGNAYVLQVSTKGQHMGLAQATVVDGEIVELVPMPVEIADWVSRFVEQHHVDEPFKKRKLKPHTGRSAGGPPSRRNGG